MHVDLARPPVLDDGALWDAFGGSHGQRAEPLLQAVMPKIAKALRASLAEFKWFYNHVRVHQNLDGLTPMEAWNGRTLVDVRQAHARGEGRWVEAMQGQLMGFYVRC